MNCTRCLTRTLALRRRRPLVQVASTALLIAACACLGGCEGSSAGGTGGAGARPSGGTGGAGLASGGSSAGGAGGGAGGDNAGGAMAQVWTEMEWALARTLSPLPAAPPADPTNRVADDPAAATLGQRLFFERGFSGALAVGDDGSNGGLGAMGDAGLISCASCHGGKALDDNRSLPSNVSLGADFLTRNSPPLVNAAFYQWTNWAGRFSALWELPIAVIENAKNMNGDRLRVAHLIFTKYRSEYQALFGPLEPALGTDPGRFPATGKPKAAGGVDGPWEGMAAGDRDVVNAILANFGKVLEAYMRKLVGGASSFDRYVAGDKAALSPAQLRGFQVFAGGAGNGGGGCASCHKGPLFTDNQFHNLALPQTGSHVPAMDNGRFADVTPLLASAFNSAGVYSDDRNTGRLDGLITPPADSTKGQFRTPSLRNVALTAPYMHAGQLATLTAVVDHYDQISAAVPVVGVVDPVLSDLHLTSAQKADLVAFLDSLNGTAVPAALLVNTAAP